MYSDANVRAPYVWWVGVISEPNLIDVSRRDLSRTHLILKKCCSMYVKLNSGPSGVYALPCLYVPLKTKCLYGPKPTGYAKEGKSPSRATEQTAD